MCIAGGVLLEQIRLNLSPTVGGINNDFDVLAGRCFVSSVTENLKVLLLMLLELCCRELESFSNLWFFVFAGHKFEGV